MRRRKSKEGEEPLSDVERSVYKREEYVRSENERQQTAVDDGDALMKQMKQNQRHSRGGWVARARGFGNSGRSSRSVRHTQDTAKKKSEVQKHVQSESPSQTDQ